MWLILQQEKPQDFVIATGVTSTLESFVDTTFKYFGLDWRRYVEQDERLFRPTDLLYSCADPSKAIKELHWHPKIGMPEVVKGMIMGLRDLDITVRV